MKAIREDRENTLPYPTPNPFNKEFYETIPFKQLSNLVMVFSCMLLMQKWTTPAECSLKYFNTGTIHKKV